MNTEIYDDNIGLMVELVNIKTCIDNLGHAINDQRRDDALECLANLVDSLALVAKEFNPPIER